MNSKEIKDLILTLNETNINKFEIQYENFKMTIEKSNSNEHLKLERLEEKVFLDNNVVNENIDTDENVYIVKAPIMGTFYKAPSPDSSPYVQLGTKVKKGDVLCILEAMKLMNEIESEVEGEIIKILVENEQLVEYNQPLFEIRLSK
ncbi:acetyl-CoA carboxylase biotin carboxyl carrier protein [Alkalithermobacter thermoalcaliphilus JW-YL-7 = DSM 7308]|uniref:Biotin carboxyl carrier protein of acetyl-CoA carboxylase n=1 Tax=Alkalithermobacter thermoalcaliphilus JW-YL-7 = DSM 7308 TaxID=1121328 RepID=A0A150FQI4_CLOPD|nr:acetyl-CoA carboxylase, biotin carboxyl carrier protein [[Clostridium] paradoxum JW-YL-7 = DSM 7308]SHK79241.1 acetyl-CoA carboxylase biotin carboxyl carrier protein [[Clostridium] paradoxum JW-YL-7 = DSM 7308]